MSDAYDLFREGQKRLRKGMTAQATVPLEKAKRLEPEKASIREALGIAYFRLARWQDAEVGYSPPDVFIPVAEAAALIRPLTEHVLAVSLRQVARWREIGLDLTVAVKV